MNDLIDNLKNAGALIVGLPILIGIWLLSLSPLLLIIYICIKLWS